MGDLPGGHVMRQMEQRFFDVSSWLYVFFLNLWVRLHAWGGIVLVFKNARLTSPILLSTTTTPSSKRWDLLSFSLDPGVFFFNFVVETSDPSRQTYISPSYSATGYTHLIFSERV